MPQSESLKITFFPRSDAQLKPQQLTLIMSANLSALSCLNMIG